MKRNKLFLSIILCLFLNVRCSEPQNGGKTYLNISKLVIDLPDNNAFTQGVEVVSTGDWTAKVEDAYASWITISVKSGAMGLTTVNVNISTNPTTKVRNGEIKFTLAGENRSFDKVIKIVQPGKKTPGDTYFTISPESKDALSEAGSFIVEVRSSAEWKVEDVPSWITLSQVTGSGDIDITVNYEENTTTKLRLASITFTSGDFKEKLLIPQSSKPQSTISLPISSKSTNPKADKFEIEVVSNTNWEIIDKPAWVSVSKEAGIGDMTITVSYEANTSMSARNGSIEFAIIGKSATFELVQQAETINILLDITSQDIPYSAGTFNINLTSNTDWSIMGKPEWVTISSLSGKGNAIIKIDYEANADVGIREAILTFMTKTGESVKFLLKQAVAAPSFNISPDTEIILDKNADSKTITITSNLLWNVTSSDNWLNLDKTSGAGNGSVVLSADANVGDIRTATIIFEADGNIRKTVNVKQGLSQLPDLDIDEL